MRKIWILTGVAAIILSMALIGCPIEEEKESLPPITEVWMYGDFLGGISSNATPFELTKSADEIFSKIDVEIPAGKWLKFVGNGKTNADNKGIFFAPKGSADKQVYCYNDDKSETFSFSVFRDAAHLGKKAWKIMSPGTYTITVNMKTSEVIFELTEGESVEPIKPDSTNFDAWLVGGATAVSGGYSGWEMPTKVDDKNPNKMTKTAAGEFSWNGHLKADKLAFVTNKVDYPDWDVDGWFTSLGTGDSVPVNGVVLNTPKVLGVQQKVRQEPMFKIETAGMYTINLNTKTMKVTFTLTEADVPYDQLDAIWLVGGAAAWQMPSDGNSYNMTTTDKKTYTLTTELNAGVVAFITDFKGEEPGWDNNSVWFVANENIDSGSHQTVVSGIEYPAVRIEGKNNDYNMFNITQAGNYTITLNVNTLKVKFVKN